MQGGEHEQGLLQRRLMVTNVCLCVQMTERLLDVENEAMLKIVELEKQLMQTNKELDHIRVRVSKSVIGLVSGSVIQLLCSWVSESVSQSSICQPEVHQLVNESFSEFMSLSVSQFISS